MKMFQYFGILAATFYFVTAQVPADANSNNTTVPVPKPTPAVVATNDSTKNITGPCPLKQEEVRNSLAQDRPVPTCNADGTFTGRQRNGFADYCWCVDKNTGAEINGTGAKCDNFTKDCDSLQTKPSVTPAAEPPATNVTGACAMKRKEFIESKMTGRSPPTCNADGTYTIKQENTVTKMCWCVDKMTGATVEGTEASCTGFSQDCSNPAVVVPTVKPTAAALNACQKKVAEMASSGKVGQMIPKCNKEGLFETKQEDLNGKYCWCVVRKTGEEIKDTKGDCVGFNKECDKLGGNSATGLGKNKSLLIVGVWTAILAILMSNY